MKKILILMAILVATSIMAADRYQVSMSTIGYVSEGADHTIETVVTSAALTYANTNENAFTLDSGNAFYKIEMYKDYVVTVQVIYAGNPNDVNLTIGTASCGHELTAANAISQLDTDFWSTEVINLDTSGGTDTDYYLIPDCLLNGKYLYFKYQYSGDPGNDPKIAVFVNRI